MPALEIAFHRTPDRRYRTVIVRADGVTVEMTGGSWNRIGPPPGELPHDLAHLVVERAFALDRGVWGVLAAGGLFRGAKVIAGRRRPHATDHAARVLAEANEPLNQAEILTRAICDLSRTPASDLRALRAATGERWWPPTATPAALHDALDELARQAQRWDALPAGEALRERWP